MSCVVISVEADQIAVKHAREDLVSYRQDSIDLTTGEGSVEEESKLDVAFRVANLLSEHCWEQHQVVVMDPDEVIVLYVLCDCLGKETVGFAIGVPRRFIKGDLTRMVVEKRPENRVCGRSVVRPVGSGRGNTTHWRNRCNVCRPDHRP